MFVMLVRGVLVLCLAGCANAHARLSEYDDLIRVSALEYNLHPCLLKAVLVQEGGTNGQVSKHKNGEDVGLSQIWAQGSWMRYFNKLGIEEKTLRENAAVNILAGAHILDAEIKRSGGDIILGVAAYHAGHGGRHKKRAMKYSKSVISKFYKLIKNDKCYYVSGR